MLKEGQKGRHKGERRQRKIEKRQEEEEEGCGGARKSKEQEGEGERGRTSGLAWISTGKIAGPAGDFLLCFSAVAALLPCGANGDSMCVCDE